MPERPDPVTDRLSRFTPSAGLDRDAILFAAGRRSARISQFWPVLAGLLAISQAATLIVLWPRSPEATLTPPAATIQPSSELSLPPASPPSDVLSAGSQPEILQREPAPVNGEYVPPGPTLTVASVLRFD